MGKTVRKNGYGVSRSENFKVNKARKYAKRHYRTSHRVNRRVNRGADELSFVPFDGSKRTHKNRIGSGADGSNYNLPNNCRETFNDETLNNMENENCYYGGKVFWTHDGLGKDLASLEKKLKDEIKEKNTGKKYSTCHLNEDLKYLNATKKQFDRRGRVGKFKGHLLFCQALM